MPRRPAAPVAAALALALLAGCGGHARGPVAQTAPPTAEGRKVVSTANLTVRVDDASQAAQEAARIATGAGGYVLSQSADLEGHRGAQLTLRVPPTRLDDVLDRVAGLGTALSRQFKAEDVTDQVVDVDGRLRTAQTSVDRLRAMLADARTTADLVTVEAELAKREGELESLQGRQRVLNNETGLATVNVRLTEQAGPSFAAALDKGWTALNGLGGAALALAGFALPFAPLVAGGVWLVRRQSRRASPNTRT